MLIASFATWSSSFGNLHGRSPPLRVVMMMLSIIFQGFRVNNVYIPRVIEALGKYLDPSGSVWVVFDASLQEIEEGCSASLQSTLLDESWDDYRCK